MKKIRKKGTAAALAPLLCLACMLCACTGTDTPGSQPPHVTAPIAERPTNGETVPVDTAESLPEETVSDGIDLGFGLTMTDAGRYTGLYMEDGSNELLSDVMMVIVRNDGQQDIQLAEFTAETDDGTYTFRLTNLAVGARAVLLDLNRQSSGGEITGAVMDKAVLFDAPMELCEDRIQVTGLDGMVNVKNISDEDITGDILVYYKYASEDLYYGGITFRIRVEGGLNSGEIRQIPAGHYSADGCAVVQVTIYE